MQNLQGIVTNNMGDDACSTVASYVSDIAKGDHAKLAAAVRRGVLNNSPVLEGIVTSCIQLAAQSSEGIPVRCRRGWQQSLSESQRDRVFQVFDFVLVFLNFIT